MIRSDEIIRIEFRAKFEMELTAVMLPIVIIAVVKLIFEVDFPVMRSRRDPIRYGNARFIAVETITNPDATSNIFASGPARLKSLHTLTGYCLDSVSCFLVVRLLLVGNIYCHNFLCSF